MNSKELLKEASDLISDLSTEVASGRARILKLEKELNSLKEASDRETLAKDLELKGFVPMEKISALRNNRLSTTDIEDLKKMAQLDPAYISQVYDTTKIASVSESIVGDDAELRKHERAQMLINSFNQYSLK